MPSTHGDRIWYSCAETAKLVRVALVREFPGVKFGVRSSTYANGASIRVTVPKGGPDRQKVRAVVSPYAGGGFDGMIDMAYSRDAYLDEAGRVRGTDSSGTEGSRGSVPAHHDAQAPNTRRVHFGADYVFVEEAYD